MPFWIHFEPAVTNAFCPVPTIAARYRLLPYSSERSLVFFCFYQPVEPVARQAPGHF